MSTQARDDGGAAFALAVLRATLVVVIFVSEHLVDSGQLVDSQFPVVLALAAAYAVACIVAAVSYTDTFFSRTLARLQPGVDILLLAALAYTSGGAYSDLRKAFFVIPLAAAFSERARTTALWSLVAVVTFSSQAILAGGHPPGVHNTWQTLTADQDLYLAWTGVAATMLAVALGRRSAQTRELAAGRQRLVNQAIESVERERTRLAGALHDSAVQNLIAARHDLRRAERHGDEESFLRLHEAIDLTVADLREEIFNLHPHVLEQVGLRAALEQVARRQSVDEGPRVIVEIEADADNAQRQVLFALGRELLVNAIKHAGARTIRLDVRRRDAVVVLEVADDGRGIPIGRDQQALLDGHIGLASVKERVSALGGTVKIETAASTGTTVRVTLPGIPAKNEPPTELEHFDPASHRSVPRIGWPANTGRSGRDISDRVTPQDTLRVSPT